MMMKMISVTVVVPVDPSQTRNHFGVTKSSTEVEDLAYEYFEQVTPPGVVHFQRR